MKAVLLAAGLGTRLRPLTLTTPKCLVPFGETTLLGIWVRQLELAGIEEVMVNLHHLPEVVLQYLEGITTTVVVRTTYERELLGSLGTLLENDRFFRGEQSILVAYADNLSSLSLEDLMRFHLTHSHPVSVAVAETDRPKECGILEVDNQGVVRSFTEKPDDPKGNLANAGIYIIDTSALEGLSGLDGGTLDIGFHFLPRMVGNMVAWKGEGYIQDVGTPERYAAAKKEFMKEPHAFF